MFRGWNNLFLKVTSRTFVKLVMDFIILVFVGCVSPFFVCAQNNTSQLMNQFNEIYSTIYYGGVDDLKKIIKKYDVNSVMMCKTMLNGTVESLVVGTQEASVVVEKVKLLLEAGADVNKVGCLGKTGTPLTMAVALMAKYEIYERDLKNELEKKIDLGEGECGIPGVFSKLCKDITYEEKLRIENALHYSFEENKKRNAPYILEIVKMLVENGANVNQKIMNNMTPLHIAALVSPGNSLESMKYLIEHGANLNAQTMNGATPLHAAASANNKEAIKILINAGADETLQDNSGETYLEVDGSRKNKAFGLP